MNFFVSPRFVSCPVGLVLEVTYTDDYPNEVPRLSVRSLKGISSKLCRELQDKIMATAQELVGMQMIYNLAQELKVRSWDSIFMHRKKLHLRRYEIDVCPKLKLTSFVSQDWLDEQNMDELTKQKEKDKAKEEVEIEKEAAVRRLLQPTPHPCSVSFSEIIAVIPTTLLFLTMPRLDLAQEYRLAQSKDGTACTKESFKAWFAKFLDAHPTKPRMINEALRGKLTGRQIFETMSLSAIAQMAANGSLLSISQFCL
jgi:hypothetical protein